MSAPAAPGVSTNPGGTRATAFDAADAWMLNPRVAVRPEPFGALLYHFGTRKLSFLKNTTVVDLVRSLADHPTAESALGAAGITDSARPLYLQALDALARSGMIVRADTGSSHAASEPRRTTATTKAAS